jgi:16S rRNA (guanine527-N7)-methyltransferase
MPSPTSETAEQILQDALAEWQIALAPTQLSQFRTYADLLVDWNANRMNLTRLTAPEEIAISHFLDSLAISQVCQVPHSARLIDVGTGPGFPGLAIKILRPDMKLTLLEATQKKLTFCREVAAQTGLENVNFVHGRAEATGESTGFRGMFDVVTARAVAPMEKLILWTEPFIARNGVFVAWKGPSAEDEMAAARSVFRRLKLSWRIVPITLPLSGDPLRVHRYIVCQREV